MNGTLIHGRAQVFSLTLFNKVIVPIISTGIREQVLLLISQEIMMDGFFFCFKEMRSWMRKLTMMRN